MKKLYALYRVFEEIVKTKWNSKSLYFYISCILYLPSRIFLDAPMFCPDWEAPLFVPA